MVPVGRMPSRSRYVSCRASALSPLYLWPSYLRMADRSAFLPLVLNCYATQAKSNSNRSRYAQMALHCARKNLDEDISVSGIVEGHFQLLLPMVA